MIRRRPWVGIVMALVLAPAGCGDERAAEAVKTAKSAADAICACQDLECATQAAKAGAGELDKYSNAKLDADAEKAVKAAGKRASDCMSKFAEPAAPEAAPTPLDAAAAAADPDAAMPAAAPDPAPATPPAATP